MLKTALLTAAIAAFAVGAHAAVITDPAGDFLPSFVGAQTGGRDVLTVSATDNNGTIDFNATFAGPVSFTDGTLHVFGIDRGQGTARFGALANGVLFDSVVSVTPGGATVVRDLLTGMSTTLVAGATTIAANALDVRLADSLLPSTGFALSQYGINLWPRVGTGNNNQITDFAPDNSVFVLTVPEPASLVLLGIPLLGMVARRRRV